MESNISKIHWSSTPHYQYRGRRWGAFSRRRALDLLSTEFLPIGQSAESAENFAILCHGPRVVR
jgi:hypothetical protein